MIGQQTPSLPVESPTATAARRTWFRWVICGLLFFATTIGYIDRGVIGLLKSKMEEQLHFDDRDFGNLVFSFQAAYALGYLASGPMMDRLGVRVGFALAVFFWSVAAMAHGLMRSAIGFCAARFGLGLAEGGNFPGAIKAVGEWFPQRERALATGIFNAGSNVGALLTPLLVPWITMHWGWPAAFYVTGAFGFLWLVFWIPVYRLPEHHPRVSPGELAHIRSDPPTPQVKVPWLKLLPHRQTWAFTLGMFVTAPVWWFYLYWTPDFLEKTHHVDLKHLGLPLVVIYLMTDVGSIGGGWISSTLLKRGFSVNVSRKVAMLVCALCVVPVFYVPFAQNMWTAVLLIGLAASAHQGFSANLFTLVSDMAPRQAVSSVVGIGGMAGAIGGMFAAQIVGRVLYWTHSYTGLFVVAASAYLLVLLAIHLLAPRLEPMKFQPAQ